MGFAIKIFYIVINFVLLIKGFKKRLKTFLTSEPEGRYIWGSDLAWESTQITCIDSAFSQIGFNGQ